MIDFNLQRFATIINWNSNTLVSGTSGSDTIFDNFGESVTINPGAGNDYISLSGSRAYYNVTGGVKIQYANGDGNDTIIGFDSNDTIQITSGNYSTVKSGNDFIISLGSGSIVLADVLSDSMNSKLHVQDSTGAVKIYNDLSLISGTSENDNLKNYAGDSLTIDAGDGDDSIYNKGYFVTINAGNGNDSIFNQGASVEIYTGEGNDTIIENAYPLSEAYYNCGSTINAGAGNDSIYTSGNSLTINAGNGNDSIYTYGNSVTINPGAGNDYISMYGDDFLSSDNTRNTKIQ